MKEIAVFLLSNFLLRSWNMSFTPCPTLNDTLNRNLYRDHHNWKPYSKSWGKRLNVHFSKKSHDEQQHSLEHKPYFFAFVSEVYIIVSYNKDGTFNLEVSVEEAVCLTL